MLILPFEIGTEDGIVYFLQSSSLKLLSVFKHAEQNDTAVTVENDIEAAVMSVECVGFSSSNKRWVASGGMDGAMKVWDTATASCRAVCLHDDGVVALEWHPLEHFVCTASLDTCARVWDARNGACIHKFTGHHAMITSIALGKYSSQSEGGRYEEADYIVSVSDDNTARVFMIPTESKDLVCSEK